MKNLRNLIKQDSDSFNEKLKIVVYTVLGLKFFLIVALLFGGCKQPEPLTWTGTWVSSRYVPEPCENGNKILMIYYGDEIQAYRVDSLGNIRWVIYDSELALESMRATLDEFYVGDTSSFTRTYCEN